MTISGPVVPWPFDLILTNIAKPSIIHPIQFKLPWLNVYWWQNGHRRTFLPYLVALWPWSLIFWPQNLISLFLSQSASNLYICWYYVSKLSGHMDRQTDGRTDGSPKTYCIWHCFTGGKGMKMHNKTVQTFKIRSPSRSPRSSAGVWGATLATKIPVRLPPDIRMPTPPSLRNDT